MNEAAEVTEDIVDAPQENEVVNDDKPAGYHPVDVEDPVVKDRINYLYKQVKNSSKDLNQYRSIAAQQAAVIEELRANQGHIVNHLQNETFNETEARVTAQFKAAYESGDVNALMEAQNKLTEIKARKINAETQRQQPQQQTRQSAYLDANVSNISADAVASGEFTQQEADVTNAWASETNERGEPIRPWINNSTGDPNDPDPDYVKAWVVANKVFNDPKVANWTINQKLAEVDKRMGVNKQTSKQTVMGGALTGKAKSSKVTLSPEAEKIAVRTKFGASKGAKSDAEYIAAYRKQMETVRTPKRSA